MANHERLSLSDIIAQQLEDSTAEEIVATAVSQGLSGKALHLSLVLSGAAMGVDRVQQHMTQILNSQIGLMKAALKSIDEKIAQAQGDDEMLEFVSSLRAPLVARVQEHIDTVMGSYTQEMEREFGIDHALFISKLPISEFDPSALRAAGAAAAFNMQASFYGFVLKGGDVSDMKCPCPGHLAEFANASHKPGDEILANAIRVWGSFDAAMSMYGVFLIDYVRAQMVKFEETFGSLEMATTDQAADATSAILSQFFTGGAKHGDSTE